MALKNLNSSRLNDMLSKISAAIKSSTLTGDKNVVASFSTGMESLSGEQLQLQNAAFATTSTSLSAELTGDGMEELVTPAGIEAASIVSQSLYTGGLEAYRSTLDQMAKEAAADPSMGIIGGSRYGSSIANLAYGLEAFDNAQNLVPSAERTVAYNVRAAKQDAVGEGFFPTTVLTPNDVGLVVTCPVDIVEPFVTHSADGAETDWRRKKLVNALRDPSILQNDANQLIPVKKEDGTNDKYFVDEADVPAVSVTANEEAVRTAPLKANVKIGSFLGLCSTPALVRAGVMDASDMMDSSNRVERIYLKVGDGSSTEVVVLETKKIDRALFQKSQEGDRWEMNLNFNIDSLPIAKGKVKKADGTEPTVFDGIFAGDNFFTIEMNITGKLNTEKGGLQIWSSPAAVRRVYSNAKKAELAIEGTLKDAVDALTIEFLGYDLDSRLRNSNFRVRGQRIDRQTSTARYLVQLGAPFTAMQPATTAWGPSEGSDVETLATATYARNSNLAIARLLDYCDTLRDFIGAEPGNALFMRYDENMLEGVGKTLVDPWYFEQTYDLTDIVNSTKSSQRRADVSEAILNVIRAVAYRMNAESGYSVALGLIAGAEQPHLIAATDNILAQYLMEVGDIRTAGITFKFDVYTTNNIDMRGKVILTLSRQKAGGFDPLTFGMHVWIPEVVATVSLNRGAGYVQETVVQPRNTHIVICPIAARLGFEGLEDSYMASVDLPVYVTGSDVTPTQP